ncbi:antiviral reverse transcriptase Drt3a [Acinetobacter oleivorans]|uniref:antiviral reverse transcriptase Drt3a n=1 Tax=Acinetobacter oleivorans TaxID=1148157 RepID=UPI0011A215CE|nr:antiviral reverse transcriptase Drt3a [Acinetobacter oleivorans]
MLDGYSAKHFARAFKKNDIQRFQLSGVEVEVFFKELVQRCHSNKYNINGLKISKDKKIHYIHNDYPHEHLMTRHCSNVLINLHNIRTPDRRDLITLLANIIKDGLKTNYISIHRFDIKSFYESIKFESVEYIINDSRLESGVRTTLKSLYKNKNKLFRGVSVTAVLSEIYMKDFDYRMKSNKNILYFFRYVDDMVLIVKEGINEKEVLNFVETNLPDGLYLNNNKHSYLTIKNNLILAKKCEKRISSGVYFPSKLDSECFIDFLGYKFIFTMKSKMEVEVGISEVKKSLIKKKILRSFFKYRKEKDFNMLVSRLNYLCSNVRILSSRRLYSGIYYNYSLIDFDINGKCGAGYKDLCDIDNFIKSIIYNGNNHPVVRGIYFNRQQILDLKKISIISGFNDRRILKLSNERISKIKGAWYNV